MQLVLADPTGLRQRWLRRFTYSTQSCPSGSGHDASRFLGRTSDAPLPPGAWPREDHRWPRRCRYCPYRFAPADQWQVNELTEWQRRDSTEPFIRWGKSEAPPGTMLRAEWADSLGPGDAYVIILPDGGTWITTQDATGGGSWTVTGVPPRITVTPSIWHNMPHGWHGFITDGELVSAG